VTSTCWESLTLQLQRQAVQEAFSATLRSSKHVHAVRQWQTHLELHMMSGLGVRPALISVMECATTRSQ
jgi:hypothetical protein